MLQHFSREMLLASIGNFNQQKVAINTTIETLSAQKLELDASIAQCVSQKAQIDGWLNDLETLLSQSNDNPIDPPFNLSPTDPLPLAKRQNLTEEGRQAKVDANKRRWAKVRAEKKRNQRSMKLAPEPEAEQPKKRTMTPEQRAEHAKRMRKRYKLYGGLARPKTMKASR